MSESDGTVDEGVVAGGGADGGRADGNDPSTRLLRLLFWNVFLLKPRPVPGLPRMPALGEMAAPAVTERASEIGARLGGRFDVVAMSEAFDPIERSRILDAWPSSFRPAAVAGPERSVLHGPLGFASSGLFTIVDGMRITRIGRHKYATRGSYVRDADALANKGVLLAEVDPGLGRGRIEIFSTHLFYGGYFDRTLTGDELMRRHEIRMAQAAELVAFAEAKHRKGNVIACVGDFNVPAVDDTFPGGPTAQHDELMAVLEPLGVRDVWAEHGIGVGPTCGAAADPFADQTDPDEPDALADREGTVQSDSTVGGRSDSSVDPEWVARRNRIDYLFVQAPQDDHILSVDMARPRRWAFPRDPSAPHFARIPRASDHLGVSVELRLARR